MLSGVAGLVLGVLAGFLVFGLGGSGTDDGDDPAARDVAYACTIVQRLAADDLDTDDVSLDDPLVWEVGAISQLLSAAGKADDAYATEAERGEELLRSVQRLDLEQMRETLERIESSCE